MSQSSRPVAHVVTPEPVVEGAGVHRLTVAPGSARDAHGNVNREELVIEVGRTR